MATMGLTKRDLLAHLARTGEADAGAVAATFGIRYAVAAMALLRLVRQGLATRSQDARGVFRYRLTERGQSRLAYLQERVESAATPDTGGGD